MDKIEKSTFCIVDIETTGSGALHDRILEIAVIKVKNGKIIDTFKTLLNPGGHISPFITQITGIRAQDIVSAPAFDEIALNLKEFLEDTIFVAHSARFDYGFVKNEFKRLGISFSSRVLCTVKLSKKLYPKYLKHNLDVLIERFNINCIERHRAYGDALATYEFFTLALKEKGSVRFNKAILEILKERAVPSQIGLEAMKNLPESSGVYIFYGEDDEVLYVGKSKNIKTRVMSHFSADHSSQKERRLSEEVSRIEARETPGELGALLLESNLIKELSPLYNRMLRKSKKLLIAKKKLTEAGYYKIVLEYTDNILIQTSKHVMGLFKSAAQAKDFLKKTAKEYFLCPKLLDLEKGDGPCFYSQLDQCFGACVQKEVQEKYNKRLELAFKMRRIKSWPFVGPILIEENKNETEGQAFVVDNWKLESVSSFEEGSSETCSENTEIFDYDAYKILVRYILDPVNKRKIRQLSYDDLRKTKHYLYQAEHQVVE